VTGVSYMQERVTENLARSLRTSGGEVYSVAALHANIGHQSGHADYAPASVTDLIDAGFDYWALGHVHTRTVLSESPAIVYPGNPQGRHARETGPRGCYEVTVDGAGRTHLEFVETNVVRWAHLEVAIDRFSAMDGFLRALEEKARQLASRFEGPTVVRCSLTGNGPLHTDLNRDGVAAELAEHLASIVAVESVRVVTGPEVDRVRAIAKEPVVGDLVRLVERAREDEAFRQYLAESLEPLFRRRDIPAPDPARLEEWIDRAGNLGVDLLLGDS
jgi:DNA repair exonuclease SbcCD nuclease subunit